MKKINIVLIIGLLLAMCLSGCGKKEVADVAKIDPNLPDANNFDYYSTIDTKKFDASKFNGKFTVAGKEFTVPFTGQQFEDAGFIMTATEDNGLREDESMDTKLIDYPSWAYFTAAYEQDGKMIELGFEGADDKRVNFYNSDKEKEVLWRDLDVAFIGALKPNEWSIEGLKGDEDTIYNASIIVNVLGNPTKVVDVGSDSFVYIYQYMDCYLELFFSTDPNELDVLNSVDDMLDAVPFVSDDKDEEKLDCNLLFMNYVDIDYNIKNRWVELDN